MGYCTTRYCRSGYFIREAIVIVVYTAKCLACANKALHRRLNEYALENKVRYQVRRTNISEDIQAEADSYGLQLPFVVVDGVAKRIEEL